MEFFGILKAGLDRIFMPQAVVVLDPLTGLPSARDTRQTSTVPVVVGTPEVVDMLAWGVPTGVTVIPGASGTMSVEWSRTETAVSNPGTATWTNWTAGTVSAKTSDALDEPVRALRVTAFVANGTIEMVGA